MWDADAGELGITGAVTFTGDCVEFKRCLSKLLTVGLNGLEGACWGVAVEPQLPNGFGEEEIEFSSCLLYVPLDGLLSGCNIGVTLST